MITFFIELETAIRPTTAVKLLSDNFIIRRVILVYGHQDTNTSFSKDLIVVSATLITDTRKFKEKCRLSRARFSPLPCASLLPLN